MIIYGILVVIHVIACLFLIAVILLQAGRGGGLAESFSFSESIFGTKTSSFLQKTTTVCAITFILTCLSLAFLTAQRSKSLVGKTNITQKMFPLPPEPVKPEAAQKTAEPSAEQPKAAMAEVPEPAEPAPAPEAAQSETQAIPQPAAPEPAAAPAK